MLESMRYTPLRGLASRRALSRAPLWLALSLALPGAGARDAAPVGAHVVLNCNDDGPGSLRAVAATSGANDPIDLTHLTCSTITLTSGAIVLATNGATRRLTGRGAGTLAIDGGGADRVFDAQPGGGLFLTGMTLRNGRSDGDGGCVRAATVQLDGVTVEGCHADGRGGGLYAQQAAVYRSRIVGNEADATGRAGGGIYAAVVSASGTTFDANEAPNGAGGALAAASTIARSTTLSRNHAAHAAAAITASSPEGAFQMHEGTISGNRSDSGGALETGALYMHGCTVAANVTVGAGAGIVLRDDGSPSGSTLTRTLVSDNLAAGLPSDLAGDAGVTLAGDHDLIRAASIAVPPGTLAGDPQLLPLADNGGATHTHALRAGSIAIDAGGPDDGVSSDQRGDGFARVVGTAPDIGAYERQTTGVSHLVTSCADAGPGSLRDSIASAASGDRIDLRDMQCATISLTTGALDIVQPNLDVEGPGAGSLTIDGGGLDRIAVHRGAGTLTIGGLTLANGYTGFNPAAEPAGGCVRDGGTLRLVDATVRGCRAYAPAGKIAHGGAIYAKDLVMERSRVVDDVARSASTAEGGGIDVFLGSVTIRDSTISGNTASGAFRSNYNRAGGLFAGFGDIRIERSTFSGNSTGGGPDLYGIAGGVMLYAAEQADILDSTISGNHATYGAGLVVAGALGTLANSTIAMNVATDPTRAGGAEIDDHYGRFRIESSILANNTNGSGASDVASLQADAQIIGAHNLVMQSSVALPPDTIADDPALGPLADNGGATWTHALGTASPAIDHGDNAAALAFDQRGNGFARVVGKAADIGAVEAGNDVVFADGFEHR